MKRNSNRSAAALSVVAAAAGMTVLGAPVFAQVTPVPAATPPQSIPAPAPTAPPGNVAPQRPPFAPPLRRLPPGYNPSNFPPSIPSFSAPTAAQLKAGKNVTLPATLSVSGVAAIVNGQKITNQQLVTAFLRDGGQQTLQQLITTSELEQAAQKAHVTVTSAEISADLDQLKQRLLSQQPGQTWSNFLASRGLSQQYATEQTRLQLLAEKVALANSGQPPFTLAGKVHVYHILFATQQEPGVAAPLSDTDAKAKATQVLADIRAHRITFQEAAKKYSQDPGSGSKGGDLGWVSQSDPLDASFKTAAFALKEGQISEPVKSQFGYHLIYAAQMGEHATAAEVSAVADQTLAQRAQPFVGQYVRQLQAGAKVQNILIPAPPAAALPPAGPRVPPGYRGPIFHPGNPNGGARPIPVPPGTPGATPAPGGSGAGSGARPAGSAVPPPPPL